MYSLKFHLLPLNRFLRLSQHEASKTTGLDGLGPRIINKVGQVLSPGIVAFINKSIQTGVFPDQLKCAKVFPIYKSGNKSDPGNYRPILILPTISKSLKGILTNI